jgi:hypothetical protein
MEVMFGATSANSLAICAENAQLSDGSEATARAPRLKRLAVQHTPARQSHSKSRPASQQLVRLLRWRSLGHRRAGRGDLGRRPRRRAAREQGEDTITSTRGRCPLTSDLSATARSADRSDVTDPAQVCQPNCQYRMILITVSLSRLGCSSLRESATSSASPLP